MNQSIVILGRQPELGVAELESLLGAKALKPLGKQAMLIDMEPTDIPLHRLGGTIKVAKLLTFLPYTDWQSVSAHLLDNISQYLEAMPDSKIRIGLSNYGLKGSVRAVNATGLSLKQVVRASGRSVRVVPNKSLALNSAQVLHNQLAGSTGVELLVVRDRSRAALAQTVNIQDIEAYTARDQQRPKRDTRVGMLPPKLAQIIVNLAAGPLYTQSNHEHTSQALTMLDPFCGTGVLLQEALLMGHDAYGTDSEPRMVDYTLANLVWLADQFALRAKYKVEPGDATNFTWQQGFTTVATETYLGPPLTRLPNPTKLQKIVLECDRIVEQFLKNLARQVTEGFRLCLAVPAWRLNNSFRHLPSLDRLEELGYTRASFVHTGNKPLVYYRPDQTVARELEILVRK